jgi:hypothetical protein
LKYLQQWLVDSVFKIHRTGGSLIFTTLVGNLGSGVGGVKYFIRT